MTNVLDVLIVGGGPVGLYANQLSLKNNLKTLLVEKLPALGGQLKSLYPKNILYEVPGFEQWEAGRFIDNLVSQTEKYNPLYSLNESVMKIENNDHTLLIKSDKNEYKARTVLLATGRGVFFSKQMAALSSQKLKTAGIIYDQFDEETVIGKNVIVIGGSQETVGWALQAAYYARSVKVVNWRFMQSYGWLEGNLAIPANVEIVEPYGILEIEGTTHVTGIKVFHIHSGEESRIPADMVLLARGSIGNLDDLMPFNVALMKNGIKVTNAMLTSKPGIFAAGDVVYYSDKEKTIASGTKEAAAAINSIKNYLQAVWGN